MKPQRDIGAVTRVVAAWRVDVGECRGVGGGEECWMGDCCGDAGGGSEAEWDSRGSC